ncbi:MAG: H-NS histone family protein [Magnetococcales bacterium]|nr:H-NS histone family protein [Magnetococcales bacterium]
MQHLKTKIGNVNHEELEALELDTLIAIKKKLEVLIKQRQTQYKQDYKLRLNRKANNLGLNLSDFFEGTFPSTKKPSSPKVKPKYEYKGVKWSGRGRCPNIYQQFFNNGGKKEDLLIDK